MCYSTWCTLRNYNKKCVYACTQIQKSPTVLSIFLNWKKTAWSHQIQPLQTWSISFSYYLPPLHRHTHLLARTLRSCTHAVSQFSAIWSEHMVVEEGTLMTSLRWVLTGIAMGQGGRQRLPPIFPTPDRSLQHHISTRKTSPVFRILLNCYKYPLTQSWTHGYRKNGIFATRQNLGYTSVAYLLHKLKYPALPMSYILK